MAGNINKVIGIISGKGGVGKSTVTSALARQLVAKGYKVGIMDADILGPSIPRMFNLTGKVEVNDGKIEPLVSEEGIKIMSMNLLLDSEETPVLYRGPLIASIIRQFWGDVLWGDLDYLLIDMPPGTGDVALTVYQNVQINGVIMVTSPQSLVEMIVMKAVNMAAKMYVPLLGIVENYSYFKCPDCDKVHYIYGESKIEELADRLNTKVLARFPIMPEIASAADDGKGVSMPDICIDSLIN